MLPPESVCVTNLHCHGSAVGDTFERVGGCTDKTGNDPACPFPFLRGITSSYLSFVFFKYRKSCLWYRNTDPNVWNWFDYRQNTTNCGDGTLCMNSGNETCCFNRKGIKEIKYHNNATIPTIAEAWSTYYEDAGCSIPTTTSSSLRSTLSTSKSTLISYASTLLPVPTQSQNDIPPSSSQQPTPTNTPNPAQASTTITAIGPRGKAIIGTTSALGAVGILGAVISFCLFRRARSKRSGNFGPKCELEAIRVEDAELAAHDVQRKTDARSDRPLDGAYLGRLHELIGQDREEQRAEMTGQNERKKRVELSA